MIDALQKQQQENNEGRSPLLIHLSTDQVFDGTQQLSTEDTKPNPVNTYGQ